MKVLLVRAVEYKQVSSPLQGDVEPRPSQGSYFEVVTWGWNRGAKHRTRKFLSLSLVRSYFDKLYAGGYFDDGAYSAALDYHAAFCFSKEFACSFEQMVERHTKVEVEKKARGINAFKSLKNTDDFLEGIQLGYLLST